MTQALGTTNGESTWAATGGPWGQPGRDGALFRNPRVIDAGLSVLQRLTAKEDLAYDGEAARHAWVQADQELPGPDMERWYDRMARAGRELGLRLLPVRQSLDELASVVSPATPALTFVAGDGQESTPGWLFVDGFRRGRFHVTEIGANTQSHWWRASRLASRLGLAGPGEAGEWLLEQPSAPCESLAGHDDHHHPEPLSRLISLMRLERSDLLIILIFAIGVAVLSLAVPLAVETLVSSVAFGGLIQPVVVLALLLFGGLTFSAVLQALLHWVVEVLQRRFFLRVVADLAYRLPRVQRSAFDKEYGPELVNRFFDVLTVQKAASTLLLDGVQILLNTGVGLLLLAFYHPLLLGFNFLMLGATVYMIFVLGRGAVTTAVKESRNKYAVAAWLEELARNNAALKYNAGRELALDRADVLSNHWLSARRDHFRVVLRQIVFALGLQVLASTLMLGLGGYLVIIDRLTLAQLVAAELIVTVVVGSFTKLGKHFQSYYDILAAMDKLGHLFDLPLERTHGDWPRRATGPARLRLRNVGFAYPGFPSVFQGVDLVAEPGAKILVCGPNGAGKTTLLDLLAGLRSPTAGFVELDGVDLEAMNLEAIRQQVAVCRNEEIFEGTIDENLRVGRHELTIDDLHDALDLVGLRDEVELLPRGIHTKLSVAGRPLSNGQVQRLLMARAIAGGPRLLLLDESLDGLDTENQRAIADRLFAADAPWTLIIVTREEELRRRCDRGLLLEGGRCVFFDDPAAVPLHA